MSEDYRGHCFRITAGQAAEYAQAIRLLEGQQAEAYIADTGYDLAEIVATIQARGADDVKVSPHNSSDGRQSTLALRVTLEPI